MHEILYTAGKSGHAMSCGGIVFVLLLLLFASGCATIKDTVVLVQDADGKVGQLTVANNGGSKTLTVPNTMIEVTGSEKSPSDPKQIDQSKIDVLFAESIDAWPAEPVIFLFYFLHNSTDLVTESKSDIVEVISAVNKRKFYEISIVGHTDTTGTDEHNMGLSNARAEAVRDALIAQGIRSDRINLRYHGKWDPIVPTGDNVSEPRNRVVEVVVK
jgi:outer membrane protein OmpA-like peptidoglycan-associated protein